MRAHLSFVFFTMLFLTVFACGSNTEDREVIEGMYLNTYTADVADPATGELWGQRTIRDTLFIKALDTANVFEVLNKRWMTNTYDNKGWVTEMPGEPPSLPPYLTMFDANTYSLTPLTENSGPPLYLEGDSIHLGIAKALTYFKMK